VTKKKVAKRKSKAKKPASRKAGFFVYVLRTCDAGRIRTYVGWTTDIAQRLKKHNAGTGARTTRGRVWALVHSEKLQTRELAMSREWYLKRDRKFRKMLLDGVPHPEERPKAASRRMTPPHGSRRAASPRSSP
jgi:putative endonuclease